MRKVIVPILVVATVIAALLGLRASERLPDSPQPIVWDREACAHCHMHIGEPAFAAQAVAADGRVYDFDDPGCLLAWSAARAARGEPRAARAWFHHVREDRWLATDAVAFIRVPRSPMGSGLGAVDRSTPGALGIDEATWLAARREP